MIQFLELKNFRAFEHIRFEDLGRANLIIGGNNTGKTSVLEALVLKLGRPEQIPELPGTFRMRVKDDDFAGYWSHIPNKGAWERLLIKTDKSALKGRAMGQPGQIGCQLVEPLNPSENQNVLQIEQSSVHALPTQNRRRPSIISTLPSNPLAISNLFNEVAPLDPNNEDRIQDMLRASIEPRLKRLRYAKPKGTRTHLIYVDLGSGPMLPFTQLGQAFCRVLEIYCEIFANQPKVILIDEIENGLYYEGLPDFWSGLYEVLEDQDVQLFATTHSRECMEAAHHAAAARKQYPLRYLRLDRRVDNPEKIVATTFGQEEMQTAIDTNREMR